MNLEDRVRATLHAEAERFEPHLASAELRPVNMSRPWLALAGAAAALAVIVGTGVFLSRPEPPSDTLPPSGSTAPPQISTTVPNLPDGFEPWVPEYTLEGGRASVDLTMIDGSAVKISWPETLDLMSEGVNPNGYASMPEAARDFFIRHGDVEDVVNMFGPATVLDTYSDGRGGTVNLWSPEGAGVDYLGFQFGDWAVLVYEGGAQVETPPMGPEARQRWIESFRGETTPDGFLRLHGDEPLRIAGPGSRLSMTMRSPGGTVELAVEKCEPSEPSSPFAEFATWCDESGWVTVFVSGTPEFMAEVQEGLIIETVTVAMISGPDANGSYAYLEDELAAANVRWGETLERMGPNPAYRLTLSGHLGFRIIAVTSEVSDGVATMVNDVSWIDADPPTVESLFGIIQEAIARGDTVAVAFETPGYPSRITLGPNPQTDAQSVLDVQLESLD